MTANKKRLIYASTGFVLLLAFQNCSKGFQSAELAASGGNFASSTPTDPNSPGTGSTTTTTPTTTTLPIVVLPPPPTGATPPSDSPDAGRKILKVCSSGCPYTLPSQANAAAQDTDIIEVAAGAYDDCFSISKNGIKVRGVNGRAHLTGAKMCGGKGEIVTYGKDTVIENFEFSNMAVADQNGAGIRHQGVGLIVRNSYFHDGEEGILSNEQKDASGNLYPNDSILIENCRFERLGAIGQAHGIYLGAHLQAIIRNSEFLASRDEGHELKSRARNLSIDCSYMASLDGGDSYSLNIPDGGAAIIKNSVIEQGSPSVNSGIIDYGSEMRNNHPVNTVTFDGVTVINDRSGGTFFAVRNSTEFKIMNSNIVGTGTMYSNQTGTESGLVKTASRSSAGYAAYPALPKPAACTGKIGLSN